MERTKEDECCREGDASWANSIFCTGCVEGMREHLAEDSVDIVVTSPPYNIGVDYASHEDDMPFPDYLDWMETVGRECARVLGPEGSLFFNIGDRPSDELRSLKVAERLNEVFRLQNTIHWIKSIAAPDKGVNIGHYKPVNSYRYVNNCHEYIFHFTPSGDVELDRLGVGVPYGDKSNIGRWDQATQDVRCRGNTWFIPYDTVQSSKSHPAAFPRRLPEMCIKLHGMSGEERPVVMDPFMGAGTTALAADRLGCAWVGFETDASYVKLAEERLEEARKERRQTELPFDSGEPT
ncbi:MAG: site-specific DNA-methyltransferase [Planctomycetota bacterium]